MSRAARALAVGTARFDNSEKLPHLPESINDVREIARLLRDPAIGGFREVREGVDLTSAQLSHEIERFILGTEESETALLYYSGHAFVSLGRLFLTTTETDLRLPVSTSYPIHLLQEILPLSRAKCVVIILDCCHSARGTSALGFDRSEVVNDLEFIAFKRDGTYVLSSSLPNELSFGSTEEKGLSQFTSLLVHGIETGGADYGLDGQVDILELAQYAQQNIQGPQTPAISTYNATGKPPAIATCSHPSTAHRLSIALVGDYALPDEVQAFSSGNCVAYETIHLYSAWSFGIKPLSIGLVAGGCDTKHPSLAGCTINSVDVRKHERDSFNFDDYTTSLAGLLVSAGDDRGYQGVAPGANLIVYHVLDEEFTTSGSYVARGISLATSDGVSVLCVPFDLHARSPLLFRDVTRYAAQRGVLVCCVSDRQAPTRDDVGDASNTLNVSCYSETEGVAFFSSQAKVNSICAPGIGIWTPQSETTYQARSGDGVAAAMVAGVASMARAANPTSSPTQTINLLLETATPNHAGGAYAPIINAHRSVFAAASRGGVDRI